MAKRTLTNQDKAIAGEILRKEFEAYIKRTEQLQSDNSPASQMASVHQLKPDQSRSDKAAP